MKELIDEIWKYRLKYNLSAKEFADKCGVTAQTIHNILREIQKPSTMTYLKIKKVLDEDKKEEK